MKLITTIALVSLLTGCSFSRGSRTTTDGTKYEVTSFNFLLNRGSVKFSTADTNGFKADLEIKKQSPSAEAIEAGVRGGVEGAGKVVKGGI